MKIIFLDIDGVLNTTETFKRRKEILKKTNKLILEIDDFRLDYLKYLIKKTKAKIVLTSSWRIYLSKIDNQIVGTNQKGKELIDAFFKKNIQIYDITPYDKDRWREFEINEWLKSDPQVTSFVIIDDEETDLISYKDNLIKIKTDFKSLDKNKNGLQEQDIKKAINTLNNTKKNIKTKKLNKQIKVTRLCCEFSAKMLLI